MKNATLRKGVVGDEVIPRWGYRKYRRVLATEIKGEVAEQRFLRIVRDLARSVPWIHRSRLGGSKSDYSGVDLIVFLDRLRGGKDIKVPIQVRSSYWGALKYRHNRPECIAAGVLLFVVNKYRSDVDIAIQVYMALEDVRNQNRYYDDFFERIAGHPGRSPVKWRKQSNGPRVREWLRYKKGPKEYSLERDAAREEKIHRRLF